MDVLHSERLKLHATGSDTELQGTACKGNLATQVTVAVHPLVPQGHQHCLEQ